MTPRPASIRYTLATMIRRLGVGLALTIWLMGNNASNTLIGGFRKVSAINYAFQNRLGTENIGISQKNVLDIGVVTAQAGIQYKQGPGLAVGARASVAAARGTYCINVFGWQLEVRMDANVLSAGVESAYGALPAGGWGSKGGVRAGLFGFGYVIRLKPN